MYLLNTRALLYLVYLKIFYGDTICIIRWYVLVAALQSIISSLLFVVIQALFLLSYSAVASEQSFVEHVQMLLPLPLYL